MVINTLAAYYFARHQSPPTNPHLETLVAVKHRGPKPLRLSRPGLCEVD